MGLAKTSSAAVNLLIDIGYFPVHVNLDLLKLNLPTDHRDEILSAAESLLSASTDLDEVWLPLRFLLMTSTYLYFCLSGRTILPLDWDVKD